MAKTCIFSGKYQEAGMITSAAAYGSPGADRIVAYVLLAIAGARLLLILDKRTRHKIGDPVTGVALILLLAGFSIFLLTR